MTISSMISNFITDCKNLSNTREDEDIKTQRMTAVALRVIGAVGIAFTAMGVASAPLTLGISLLISAVCFVISRDLIVVGDNMSKMIAPTNSTNTSLEVLTKGAQAIFKAGKAAYNNSHPYMADTWVIKHLYELSQ